MYELNDKNKIIEICESMGFRLDYDQFDEYGKEWMRFVLRKEELDEKDLRWIWYKKDNWMNLAQGANILFKSGQKAKIQQLNEYIKL